MAKEFLDNKLPVHYYATENSLDAYKYHLVHMKAGFISQVKSGTVSKRIIDEGSYEETFGMNVMEFVALLTGNTDLQEKAKLEKEIAVVEGERRNFHSSRITAERRLETERKALENIRQTLSELNSDFAAFDKAAPKKEDGSRPAALRVAGVKSEDEKEMAARLKEIADTAKTGGEYMQVGKLGPFPIVVKTSVVVDKDGNHTSSNRFFVEGLGDSKIKYQYNNGFLASDPALACANFPKAMERIPGMVKNYEEKKKVAVKDVEILRRMASETWTREGELEEMRSRLLTLDKRIESSLGQQESYDLDFIQFGKDHQKQVQDIVAEDITEQWDEDIRENDVRTTKMKL